MLILLDNEDKSLPVNRPITGKIRVYLSQPFDANALTLTLCGFQRSFVNAVASGLPAQALNTRQDGLTRLSKTIISENFTVAEFPKGQTTLQGMSEYAFSIELPEVVCETLMLKFGNSNNLSVTFYLKA